MQRLGRVYALTETIYRKPRGQAAMLMQPNNAPLPDAHVLGPAGREGTPAELARTRCPIRTRDTLGRRDGLAG
ncbi:MAG TPA: hypothetical protein VFI48_03685 [Hyphomicrobiaceae bacterium]|nr:hypothetical protein [Hyphomicrobiaceae bacterium]